jgi:general secretion pathway protein C
MLTLRSWPHPSVRPHVIATAASVVLFVVVLGWWAWIFHTPTALATVRPTPPAILDASAGATLFGAQPDRGRNDTVQLLGILAFDPGHAAAVVSVGGEPAKVIGLNGAVSDGTTLREVHAHSIVVDRNGIQREIALPQAQDPSVFVR